MYVVDESGAVAVVVVDETDEFNEASALNEVIATGVDDDEYEDDDDGDDDDDDDATTLIRSILFISNPFLHKLRQ